MNQGFDRSVHPAGHLRTAAAIFAILLTGFTVASAAGLESVESSLISERPDQDGPTEVTVSVFVNDVDGIKDIEQRFGIDMFLRVAWIDPRLALPEESRSGKVRTVDLDQIWTPKVVISNDRGLTSRLAMTADIDDSGNVVFRQRLSGEMAVDLRLAEFPFDTQSLSIDLISYKYPSDALSFSSTSQIVGEEDRFTIQGWHVNILEPVIGVFRVPTRDAELSQLTFLLSAERNSRYYLLTMFLPMSLIVMMAWSVFWLRPDLVPPRIAISTASIFSLIAFGFSVRLSLPKVSYLTRADLFTVGSTLLVFLALAVAITSSRWAGSEHLEKARKLNSIARWSYLFFFGVVAAVALKS